MSRQEDSQVEVLNYFVANYCDLKDVVYTVESLIKKTATERNKAILREGCLMSIVPLKDRHAFLVRIKLHEAMRL
ncbi:MAG: hypothetical protein JSU65_10390 [Candidatus Zixiibacteriota bacterium]|nr:MAG: hypothetical protein JSU65_10390 [candidate division Zixibacteria bacterium]